MGEVLTAPDKAGIGGNTLVILTSDNGCSKAAGIDRLQAEGHYPSADMRAPRRTFLMADTASHSSCAGRIA